MKTQLKNYCEALETAFPQIRDQRRTELSLLANHITELFTESGNADITVICTHNSRRSHMASVFLSVAADYYGISGINSFSGGTEATAVHANVIQSFKNAGIDVKQAETDVAVSNPEYLISWGTAKKQKLFSKIYSNSFNPDSGFIAVMVCDEAAEACPLVIGAAHRIALPYKDPKAFDNTEAEEGAYFSTLKEIGSEMLFVISTVKKMKTTIASE